MARILMRTDTPPDTGVPLASCDPGQQEHAEPFDYSKPYRGWLNFLLWAVADQDAEAVKLAIQAGLDATHGQEGGASPFLLALAIQREASVNDSIETLDRATEIVRILQEAIASGNQESKTKEVSSGQKR